MPRSALSGDEKSRLATLLDEFIARLFQQLHALAKPLSAAGFRFIYVGDHLRPALPMDVVALRLFAEQHGPVPKNELREGLDLYRLREVFQSE